MTFTSTGNCGASPRKALQTGITTHLVELRWKNPDDATLDMVTDDPDTIVVPTKVGNDYMMRVYWFRNIYYTSKLFTNATWVETAVPTSFTYLAVSNFNTGKVYIDGVGYRRAISVDIARRDLNSGFIYWDKSDQKIIVEMVVIEGLTRSTTI
jgi:hypothetical protein